MTVQELIDKLYEMPRGARVALFDAGRHCWIAAKPPVRQEAWDVGHDTYMNADFDGKRRKPIATIVVIED